MSRPMEICLEELNGAHEEEPFIRCVALPGGDPGLALDREGHVRWMPEEPGAYGLWVSADDRLVLMRAEGTCAMRVERGSRSLEAPAGKPVILLDQDILLLGERRLRVHVHGETEEVYAPERISRSALARLARAAAAAAALALGGTAAAAAGGPAQGPQVGTPPPIEVRVRPPAPMPSRRSLDCNITSQKAGPKGPLVIQATCASATGLHVGLQGHLLDAKTGNPLQDGQVKIKTLTGNKIEAEAPKLTKRVDSKTVRFWVRGF